MCKVAIYVRGGCVQDVFASNPDCTVRIIDYDNLEAPGGATEKEIEDLEQQAERDCPNQIL